MKVYNEKLSIKRKIRMIIVFAIYSYELFNKKILVNEIYENDIFHELFLWKKNQLNNNSYKHYLKIISVIEKNYITFQKMIKKYIRNDWSWNRIPPLTRSILLSASAELWNVDTALIANEYIDITKDLIPDDATYKFVNAVIDKIGKEYDEFKNQKIKNQEN